MLAPLRTLPSLEQLVDDHASYMLRLPESDREQSATLTASLNVDCLRAIAGMVVGSTCHRVDKIYQGGFNQIFNLTYQDETIHAIARINMPFGGGALAPENERRDRVCSEAATLRWLRENTTIPVPRVFAFDDDSKNKVGAAYIIEERILGCTLSDVWSDPAMSFEARTAIVKQLADFQAQLLSTSFPMIGSLYMADTEFIVGPLAPPVQIETPRISRGPWKTAREDMKTWIQEQLEELRMRPAEIISRRHKAKKDTSPATLKEFEMIYTAILHLVEEVKLLDLCDPSWSPFSLSHPDLTENNILVDVTDTSRVIAMLDWEGARIQPWWQLCLDLPFIREEEMKPFLQPDSPEWSDIRTAWGEILIDKNVPGLSKAKIGWVLGQLHILVDGGYLSWSSVEGMVDYVKEWRLDWPEPDPAFRELDDILRRYGADIPDYL